MTVTIPTELFEQLLAAARIAATEALTEWQKENWQRAYLRALRYRPDGGRDDEDRAPIDHEDF